MSDLNTLLQQLQDASELSSQLSQGPNDKFDVCAQALIVARDALVNDLDRSAECKCECHTRGPEWHALPCGCYTGNPVL